MAWRSRQSKEILIQHRIRLINMRPSRNERFMHLCNMRGR